MSKAKMIPTSKAGKIDFGKHLENEYNKQMKLDRFKVRDMNLDRFLQMTLQEIKDDKNNSIR